MSGREGQTTFWIPQFRDVATSSYYPPCVMELVEVTEDDRQRIRLLRLISGSKDGFDSLSVEQLARLEKLLNKKDYGHDKKAQRSKKKLLKRINVRIYELEEGRSVWGAP